MRLIQPRNNSRGNDSKAVKKASKKSSPKKSKANNIITQIEKIRVDVETNLAEYKDDFITITDEEKLIKYLKASAKNGVIAIDTETTGLDALRDGIVGVGIYTPKKKTAYIPINHVSYINGSRIKNQLDEGVVQKALDKYLPKITEIIMFNANFDLRVLRNLLGVKNVRCTWDCYLAARLMNENEPSSGLKPLHSKYVLRGRKDAFSYGDLFKGINFAFVPIDIGAIYASHDPKVTYELYAYQKKYLNYENMNLKDVAWVFHNIEMPCVEPTIAMEDTGVRFDFAYNEKLKKKYHKLLDERQKQFNDVCKEYEEDILRYIKRAGDSCKLEYPVNIKSPGQLAILLYDIIRIEPLRDKRTKQPIRSTNEATLQALKHPLADAILDYREFSTIVGTFIDTLPTWVHEDGRVHCKFNQCGARTGRFSSEEPNMQNLPSKLKDIRQMFIASNDEFVVYEDNNKCFVVDVWDEVETLDGWKSAGSVAIGDELILSDGGKSVVVKSVKTKGTSRLISY